MNYWLSLVSKRLEHLLYKQTILILTIVFCVGIGISLWNMSRLSSNLIESTALENTRAYANALQISRSAYSMEVINRIQNVEGVTVSHHYPIIEGGIPVPITFLKKLSWDITEAQPGTLIKIYSEYPFQGRQAMMQGSMDDDFDREALEVLKYNPTEPFWRIEDFQGRRSLRYAQAEVMQSGCVECHNTHPDSPKTDWQIGDVRGVLEIVTPLDNFIAQSHQSLQGNFLSLGGMSLLGITGITVVIKKLRQTSQELERRVIERTAQLQESNKELAIEQHKSEHLLLNVLPKPIAERLKQQQYTLVANQRNLITAENDIIADYFPDATIMFADLVGFTQLSAQTPPQEMVKLLNDVFSAFDRICEQQHLEKIKTIGDNYMVAGGVPIPRPDHAQAIANMALGIQQELHYFNAEHQTDLNFRVGINSGPVVAGVIGTKKFVYDLWGDSVNVASRMESHSIPGKIQVGASTYELLKNKYHFEERGTIQVKGKGEMKTYFLLGKLT